MGAGCCRHTRDTTREMRWVREMRRKLNEGVRNSIDVFLYWDIFRVEPFLSTPQRANNEEIWRSCSSGFAGSKRRESVCLHVCISCYCASDLVADGCESWTARSIVGRPLFIVHRSHIHAHPT